MLEHREGRLRPQARRRVRRHLRGRLQGLRAVREPGAGAGGSSTSTTTSTPARSWSRWSPARAAARGSAGPTASSASGSSRSSSAGDLPHRRLLFEAPSTELQTYFVTRVGSDVNLGNIASTDVIGLETLRLGLRADTLTASRSAQREGEPATSSTWPSRSSTWPRPSSSTSTCSAASWRGATTIASRSTSSATSWSAT